MTSLLRSAANRFGQLPAFDDGSKVLTYSDVVESIDSLAQEATKQKGQGDRVVWCATNDLDSFCAFWTLQELGCVACPISPRFPEEKCDAILGQLNAKRLPERLVSPFASRKCGQFAGFRGAKGDTNNHAPATIILSSGSTGTPKAIVHSMASHIASAEGAAINMPLEPGDRWLWSLPLYHVSGLSILVRCAVSGATVVAIPTSAEFSAQLLYDRRITHLSLVNTQLRRLLASEQFPGPDLKSVLLGGSSVQPALVDEARARGIRVHTTYGLTEMASQVTTSGADDDPTSSGRVLRGRELKIDEDTDEILVRGDTLCLGYYRDDRIEPVVDDEGWFHTRDRGSLTNEELTVFGRMDNMFISGGENIYPEVIERELLKFPRVEQAIVVPKPDKEFEARPVAFVNGQLPRTWEEQLRASLHGLEIPIQILDWPHGSDLGIKPDRRLMQALVTDADA